MASWQFVFSLFFLLLLEGCVGESEDPRRVSTCVGGTYIDLNSVPERAEAQCSRVSGEGECRRQAVDQQDLTLEKQRLKHILQKMQQVTSRHERSAPPPSP